MNSRIHLFAFIACTLLLPLKVVAGVCDAHYTFDGNLNDSGSNGYDGVMIGAKGVVATPQFVDGKFGQALQLDGTSAMRSFADLHFDTCPEVSITAWIQATGGERKGTQELVSTGSGSGPGIRASGANLVLKGAANGIIRRNVIRPNAGWMFVAGIYDYTNGTYTLYSRNRGIDKEMGTSRKPPDEAVWVGAFSDGLANAATDILIDDVRIYGRLLNEGELRAIQANAAIDSDVGTQVATLGPACAISTDCAPGNYCAWDNTCHPDSHAPKQSLEFGVVDAGAPTQGFIVSDDARGDGQSLDEINAQLAEGNNGAIGTSGNLVGATPPPDIGYESEEAAFAAQRERDAAYQADLDRQQNDLEQQRRDEAAAVAAAEATLNTVTGGYTLSSDSQRSGVSGTAGSTIIPIDLVDEPVVAIRIYRKGGNIGLFATTIKPVGVEILGLRGGVRSTFGSVGYVQLFGVSTNPGAISGLKVCVNKSNSRVKGLEVSGNDIDDDGAFGYYRQDANEQNSCAEWGTLNLCATGSVVSGVYVHLMKASSGRDKVVGLQLICREVIPNG